MNQHTFEQLMNAYFARVQSHEREHKYSLSFVSYSHMFYAHISYDRGNPTEMDSYRNRIVTVIWNTELKRDGNCLSVSFSTFNPLSKEKMKPWIDEIIHVVSQEKLSCFITFNASVYKVFKEEYPFVSSNFHALPIGEHAEKLTHLLQYKPITAYYSGQKSIRFEHLQNVFFNTSFQSKPYLELFCYSSGKEVVTNEIYTTSDWDDFIAHSKKESERLAEAQEEIFSLIKRYAPNSFKEEYHVRVFEERLDLSFEQVLQNGKIKYTAQTPSGKRVNQKLEKLVEKVKRETETFLKKHRVKAVVAGKTNDYIYAFWKKIYGWSPDLIEFDYCFMSSFSKEEFNTHLKSMVHQTEKKELDSSYGLYFKYYLRTQKIRRKINRSYEFGDLLVFDSPSTVFVYKKEDFLQFDLQHHDWKKKEDKIQIEKLTTWKKNLL